MERQPPGGREGAVVVPLRPRRAAPAPLEQLARLVAQGILTKAEAAEQAERLHVRARRLGG